MLPIFFITYGAVFAAEIVGDKLLYTTGVLATRYRAAPILCGMVAAFMAKMGVAVAVGKAISKLPPLVVASITAINFFAIAIVLWRKPDQREEKKDHTNSRAAMVSFAAIFFSEWGDVGQVTTATLVARYHAPGLVWLAATLALVTKGGLALTLGLGLRRYVPQSALRYAALAFYIGMGILVMLRPQA